MKTLNLGIMAHVDAGKTTLTERLLYAAGVIADVGSVDEGTTQTDSLDLERQRGITIKSAVVSFVIDEVTINLIDTPGHPDFIAEVERVLDVLDAAVLVVSGVEGVQAQTRVLMRALQRLRIPTILFVNKIDRGGARYDSLLDSFTERLTRSFVAMGTTRDLGSAQASFRSFQLADVGFKERLVNVLSEHSDALLAAYVDDGAAVDDEQIWQEFANQVARALVSPVYFGSAVTGAGIPDLIDGITRLLPSSEGDVMAEPSGLIFKIGRGPAGEKVAYVRMFSGRLRIRDRVTIREDHPRKVSMISVIDRGEARRAHEVGANQIAMLWGLDNARIGDALGERPANRPPRQFFSPPTLETVVSATTAVGSAALFEALTQLSEQDPLINVRRNDVSQELHISLYGEVQKEVIQATLASDFGIEVGFSETSTIYIERLTGVGEAVERLRKEPNPFLATIGLRVEPGKLDSGIRFRLEVELGSLPLAFVKAIEETVRETLQQGIYGWEVVDVIVTLTTSGYLARQSSAHGVFNKNMSSTAGDFRNLTPLVLMTALAQAGTVVHEPIHRFRLEAPADTCGALLQAIGRLRGLPRTPKFQDKLCVIEGDIPAAQVHELQQLLPGLTSGEGVMESAFERYQEATGVVPDRPRWDHNPLNRKEYLLRVLRAV